MHDDTNTYDIYDSRLKSLTLERDRLQLENDTLRNENDRLQMLLRYTEFRCDQLSRGTF